MADPYWRRYTAAADTALPGYIPGGYIPSGASTLRTDLSSSSILQRDIMGPRYGAGVDDRPEPSTNGYPSSWEDRYLVGRRDVIHGTETGISNLLNDRPDSLRKADDVPVGGQESNMLFVDALPTDCSRREVSHLFRSFVGFKEIRLIHKEPRHSADKPMVLCFVEFTDTNHALTALEALQGYKFDNKKPDSPALRIYFAHFPFQLPSDDAHFSPQPLPDNAHFSSQPPHESARFPSQSSPTAAHFSSQRLPFPSQQVPKSDLFPSQLPLNSAHFPSQLPPNSAHFPSQVSLNSAHSSFQPSPHREEKDLTIPRVKEPAVEEEEPVVKTKKYKLPPSKKKEKEEINSKKQWCIKCKQNHFGECYNFKNCYICGKLGHIGKECTSKPRLCYGCGEPGHIHALCPSGSRPEKKGNGNGTSMKKQKQGPPVT